MKKNKICNRTIHLYLKQFKFQVRNFKLFEKLMSRTYLKEQNVNLSGKCQAVLATTRTTSGQGT